MESSPAGAGVYIGNVYKGKTPLTIDIAPGTYELVLNGYSDWRLPSKGELYLMNNSLKEEIIGGLRIAIIGLCLSLFHIYQEKRALILLRSNLLTI